MTLAEALESVDLEAGRTYRCRVRGLDVVMSVQPGRTSESDLSPAPRKLLTKELSEDDIMLDAWCELPEPKWTRRVRTTRRERFMPDIPDIPRDVEDME